MTKPKTERVIPNNVKKAGITPINKAIPDNGGSKGATPKAKVPVAPPPKKG